MIVSTQVPALYDSMEAGGDAKVSMVASQKYVEKWDRESTRVDANVF